MSRGSVIPLMISQIKDNKEITVTHKDMTRFVMPLESAVDLVLLSIKKNSEFTTTYVHKSLAAKIIDLAIILKKYYNSNYKIKMIGIRSGEKLHETLIPSEETVFTKEFKNHYEINNLSANLDYKKYFTNGITSSLKREYNSEKAAEKSNLKRIEKVLINEITKN